MRRGKEGECKMEEGQNRTQNQKLGLVYGQDLGLDLAMSNICLVTG